jgi:predicted transcriptional regulator
MLEKKFQVAGDKNNLCFDFYYGKKGDQFSFYYFPMMFIYDEVFKNFLPETKMIYGLLLSRLKLSQKNGWFDDQNRPYVIYAQAEMAEKLSCSESTIVRAMKQLRDAGLVRSEKRGHGKTSILYVMNFAKETNAGVDCPEPASGMPYDYFYGKESCLFSFLRIPRLLFSDERFSHLPLLAKFLFGLMLDRMSLSQKNGWFDKDGCVYIEYPITEMSKDLSCSERTVMRLMKELRDIGLVVSKKRIGDNNIIYVMDFTTGTGTNDEPQASELSKANNSDSHDNGEFQNNHAKIACQNNDAGIAKLTSQERRGIKKPSTSCNNSGLEAPDMRPRTANVTPLSCQIYTPTCQPDASELPNRHLPIRKSYTDFSYTDSIYPGRGKKKKKPIDTIDERNTYSEIIKENIGYDLLRSQNKTRAAEIHELYVIILETVCSKREIIRVGREDMPAEVVRGRLLKLDYTHIEYVMESISETTTGIRNIRSYLLTALYRAPETIVNKINAEINHHMGRNQPAKKLFGSGSAPYGAALICGIETPKGGFFAPVYHHLRKE